MRRTGVSGYSDESRTMPTKGNFLVAFSVVLASSLPSVVAIKEMTTTSYNAALNQRVSISQSGDTCVSCKVVPHSLPRCPSLCDRNVSSHSTADVRFPKETVKMGGIHCHVQDNVSIIEQQNICWLTLPSWNGSSSPRQSFTYSAWFKPTDTQQRQ